MEKVIVKIANLDKPNHSNTIISKQALESAINKLDNHSVPVFLGNDSRNYEFPDIIGEAKVDIDYPNMQIYIDLIENEISKSMLNHLYCGTGGFVPGGFAKYNKNEIIDATINHISYVNNPICETKYVIVREKDE